MAMPCVDDEERGTVMGNGVGTQGKKILIVSLPQSGYRHMSIFFLSAYAARHLRSELFR